MDREARKEGGRPTLGEDSLEVSAGVKGDYKKVREEPQKDKSRLDLHEGDLPIKHTNIQSKVH